MDQDPKDHDFDQRHDGPEELAEADEQQEIQPEPHPQRPTVQISTDVGRRTVSDDHQLKMKKKKARDYADEPMTAPPERHERHSVQLPRADTAPHRRSTQISRSGTWGRQSRDFDVRRDGPYGRPSITMARRRSSQWTAEALSPDVVTSPVPLPNESAIANEESKEGGAPSGAPSDQVPASVETMQSSDPAFEPEPPPLNYSLRSRKWSIVFFWSLILIDSIAMPIVLYFCLWYLTDLSPNTVFSIVTAALGGISIFEYFVRFRRLWRKGSTCRVIGARRMYLDWFHWNFTLAWVIIMVELIV